jgi:hypothetical protein
MTSIGGTTVDLGVTDAILLALDSKAAILSVKDYGGPLKPQHGDALALGPSGELVLGGRVEGTLDLPGAALDATSPSFFVARLPTPP